MKENLVEQINLFNNKLIIEEIDDLKSENIKVKGVVQRANVKNGNGRIYPKNVLEKAVSTYIDNNIRENRAFGELDHPDDPTVKLKNVSHVVRKLWWNEDDLMGEIEILGHQDYPSGRILKRLILEGFTVGISSRGMGSTEKKDDDIIVQDDLELSSWDFVSVPSTQGAFMKLIKENKNLINIENSNIKIDNLISEIICLNNNFCPCKFK